MAMFGTGQYRPLPRSLSSIVALATRGSVYLGFTTYADVPPDRPAKFARVEVVGGEENTTGTVSSPMFAFQCYAMSTRDCEDMCAALIAYLKDSQFTWYGPVQYREFQLRSVPASFDDPKITDRRRWQFTATMSLSNYTKH